MAVFEESKDNNLKVSSSEKEKIKYYDWQAQPEFYKHDIFNWSNKVYFKTNFQKPMEFFVIDYNKNRMSSITMKCEQVVEGHWDCNEGKITDYGSIAFYKMFEYLPVYEGMQRQYEFFAKDAYSKKYSYGPGTFTDIKSDIDDDGFIYDDRQIKPVLKKAKDLLKKKGSYVKKKIPPNPGFFLIDHQIESLQTYKTPETKELKEALLLLEDFASFFKENLYNLGFVLHWEIMAPFGFALKQAGNSNFVGAIYLWGKPNTGKSTVGALISHIWGRKRDSVQYSSGSIDTPFRFGDAISQSTFPIIIEEGSTIFSNREHDVLFDIFKNSVLLVNARTVGGRDGQKNIIPALSCCFITSNQATVKDGALGRRMHTFEWTMKDVPSVEEIKKFDEKFDVLSENGPMKKLIAIGNFVANYVIENPSIIVGRWEEVAREIWQEMYSVAGLEMPDWMVNYNQPAGLQEAMESEQDQLFTFFRQLVMRNAQTGPVYDSDAEEFNPRTAKDKIRDVTLGSVESWIELYTPRGSNEEFVVIDAGICEVIKKEYGVSYDLKRIAEDLNGNYTTRRKASRSVRVAKWKYSDFEDMFG